MTNKKNRFFTLVFSCCPGAGEMYLGLYRQGVSLMGLFFGTIALAAWLGFEELIFFICRKFLLRHAPQIMRVEKAVAPYNRADKEDQFLKAQPCR